MRGVDFNYLLSDSYSWIEEMVFSIVEAAALKVANRFEIGLLARPESEYYDRTGDLVEAWMHPIVHVDKNSKKIRYIPYDASYVNQVKTNPHHFNKHMSLRGETSWAGCSIRDIAIYNQNYGYHVPAGKPNGNEEGEDMTPFKKIPGLYYIENALGTNYETYINKLFENEIEEVLKELEGYLYRLGVLRSGY